MSIQPNPFAPLGRFQLILGSACSLLFLAAGPLQAQDAVLEPPPNLSEAALALKPPAGVPTCAAPLPKLDWVARVEATDERAKKVSAPIELVFDGDSITDFWQTRGKEVWTQHYARYNAFDFGISGDRTEHVLWRLSQGQVDGLHPKLVALMIGTNNLSANSAEDIATGIKAIVASYRKHCPDATILLQAIFPRGAKASDPDRAKIKSINSTISKLADGGKVVYVDFGDKFLEPDGSLSPEVMPDYLHPSAKGYEIWADAIQPMVDKYCGTKG
jgi:lysophospholipase L1-like esterase